MELRLGPKLRPSKISFNYCIFYDYFVMLFQTFCLKKYFWCLAWRGISLGKTLTLLGLGSQAVHGKGQNCVFLIGLVQCAGLAQSMSNPWTVSYKTSSTHWDLHIIHVAINCKRLPTYFSFPGCELEVMQINVGCLLGFLWVLVVIVEELAANAMVGTIFFHLVISLCIAFGA